MHHTSFIQGKDSLSIEQELANIQTQGKTLLRQTFYDVSSGLGKLEPLWNVPPQNPNFTGREEVLKTLKERLSPYQSQSQNVILNACYGLGGVGKTQIAVEYVHQYQKEYQHVFWISADSASSIETNYLILARQLGLVTEKMQVDEAVKMFKRWLSLQSRVLVVFDSAPDYATIAHYIPASGAQVLVTSRHTEWPSEQHAISINVFTEIEALAYLKKIFGPTHSHSLDDQKKLCEKMGYLPLALAQAAAYIHQAEITISDYLALYENARKGMLTDKTLPVQDKHVPVYVTWDITMKKIVERSFFASQLLYLCSYLHHDNIPKELMELFETEKALNPNKELFEQARGTLNSYSMVTVNPQLQTVSLHVLVKEILQLHRPPKEKQKDIEVLDEKIAILYPTDTKEMASYDKIKQLIPHLEAFSLVIQPLSPSIPELPRWPEKLPMETGCLIRICAKLVDGNWKIGRAAKAKGFAKQELAIKEQHYGKDHIEIADALGNLAVAFRELGEPKTAKSYLERALTIKEQYHGKDHIEITCILNNLSCAIGDLGDSKTKKIFLERALAILEQHYDKNHLEMAVTLTNLASAIRLLGDPKTAKSYSERALAIKEQHYGKEHIEVVGALGNLAAAIMNLGDAKTAKPYLERALAIKKQHYGKEHIEVANTFTNLAHLIVTLGDAKTAKAHLECALAINKQYYGKDHASVAIILVSLAAVFVELGDSKTAKTHLEHALMIQEQNYGKDYIEVTHTLTNLARVFLKLGDAKTAKAHLEYALPIQESYYGQDHIEVAMTLRSLANAIGTLGDRKTKKIFLERTLVILERHYGKNHFEVAMTLTNLAAAIMALGDMKTAIIYLKRALVIKEQYYGKDHLQLAILLTKLAFANFQLNNFPQALDEAFKAQQLFLKNWGPQHPRTLKATQLMEQIKQEQSKSTFLLEKVNTAIVPLNDARTDLEKQLRNAALQNNAQKVNDLLKQVESVDVQDTNPKWQRSALHWAVEKQAFACVELLVNAGASVTLFDAKESSPLDLAYQTQHSAVIQCLENVLLKKYNIPNLNDSSLEKALRNAVNRQELQDVRYFIRHVKNVNAQDTGEYGRTALHWAIINGFMEGIQLLLKAGAEVNLVDKKGKTALTLAQQHSNPDIRRLFQPEEKGSQKNPTHQPHQQDNEIKRKPVLSPFFPLANASPLHNPLTPQKHFSTPSLRQGLFTSTDKPSSLLFKEVLPEGWEAGAALSKGDCFFDAMAQVLNQKEGKETYTFQSLRLLCDDYIQRVDTALQKNKTYHWTYDVLRKLTAYKDTFGELKYDDRLYVEYVANIRYTAKDIEQGFGTVKEAVWGRPTLDGRMLCEKLGITLHVIEIQTVENSSSMESHSKNIFCHQLINAQGSTSVEENQVNHRDENCIHLVCYKSHFVPLLRAQPMLAQGQTMSNSNNNHVPSLK